VPEKGSAQTSEQMSAAEESIGTLRAPRPYHAASSRRGRSMQPERVCKLPDSIRATNGAAQVLAERTKFNQAKSMGWSCKAGGIEFIKQNEGGPDLRLRKQI